MNLTVNYLKEGNPLLNSSETVVAPSVTLTVREGEDYSAMLRQVDGMTVDLDKFPPNAAGQAGKEDITVNYYYVDTPKTALVLHYYNVKGWEKVGVVVYRGEGDDRKVYTAVNGDVMQPDKTLGADWYTLTLSDIGSLSDVYAVFSDTKGQQDDHFSEKGCSVSREVWIEGSQVTGTGTVNVIYLTQKGKVLKTVVQTGKVGTDYTTKQETFDGVQLTAMTANTTGSFGAIPVYVIYSYDEPVPEKRETNVLPIILAVTAAGALLLSAALFFGYRQKKKHLIR